MPVDQMTQIEGTQLAVTDQHTAIDDRECRAPGRAEKQCCDRIGQRTCIFEGTKVKGRDVRCHIGGKVANVVSPQHRCASPCREFERCARLHHGFLIDGVPDTGEKHGLSGFSKELCAIV